jgi:hypothetical protein
MKTKMFKNKFCVFIISHGRPNSTKTLNVLQKSGCTDPVFIVCDDEDKTLEEYKKNFGAKVLVFDKKTYASKVDSCDNFNNRRTTTHARNACFDFAEQLGFEYFLVLDDDYTSFRYSTDGDGKIVRKRCSKISKVFEAHINFLDCDERIKSVCFLQTGDLIGGLTEKTKLDHFPFKKRKAMNSFFCKTSRRFWFFSRLNEDVNTYLLLGSKGDLFFTNPTFYLQQLQTQTNSGGMSETYLASGTYVKSFYSVMNFPSFAKVAKNMAMNRLHHRISWENAIPKIIEDKWKKT